MKFGILKGRRPGEGGSDEDRRSADSTDPKLKDRLKAPKKSREGVTIAPSTGPGPDVRTER